MELKIRYKQTELGFIPEDWEVAPLGDHAMFKTGPFGSALHRSDYVDGGVPVVNPMQIVDGKILPTSAMSVTETAARRLSDFRLSEGNVIIGRRGEMGRCAFVRPEQHGWLCGTGSMIIRTGPSLDARFVQRILASPPIVAEIENASVGSTMINLNQGTLANLLIPLPPTRTEQAAIAEALGDTDALVDSSERLIAKKRKVKEGATQELLTARKRLPGFSKEWVPVRLGELFTFKNGLNKGKEFFGKGTPIVNYMDVFQHPAIRSSMLAGRVSLTDQELATFDVRMGDVFFTRTSETVDEVGIASVVLDDPNQTVFSGFLLRARPRNSRLCNDFKKYCFAPDYLRKQIISRASYTTRALTNGRILSAVNLLVPEPAEQLAIAEILNDIDAELAGLEDKLAKAHQIKQAMMQELLTGRTRLV
jgi:type I restriction enzyme, S subunit